MKWCKVFQLEADPTQAIESSGMVLVDPGPQVPMGRRERSSDALDTIHANDHQKEASAVKTGI